MGSPNAATTSVLVTSGEERVSLAAVRALADAGHRVHVCAEGIPSLAGASRHCVSEHRVGNPVRDADAFVKEVAGVVDVLGVDVLLPMTDAAALAILRERESFPQTCVPLPARPLYERLSDKQEVAQFARGLGMRVPEGCEVADGSGVDGLDLTGMTFPVVVKPARSVGTRDGRLETHSVGYADSPEEVRKSLRSLPSSAFPVLVQEKIAGRGLGLFLLVWDGQLLGAFAHRRIREKPPSGGVSVLRESVPLPSALLDKCRRLLKAFDWQGVAMIEFKGESLSNRPALMEVNARFWGSLQLAIDAGVNFPDLLVAAVLGRPVRPVLTYRVGVRSRWFWGDVDHLWARLRYSRAQLRLPPNAPGRIAAIADFAKGFGPANRSEILRWDDPRPAVLETLRRVRLR